MSKFGFVGPSYTAKSNAVADEECINFYAETLETPGAQTRRSYFGTPGLAVFAALPNSPTRGQCWTGERQFTAAGDSLYEVFADKTFAVRMDGVLDTFGGPVSIVASNIELLIVAGGRAYCYNLAANTFNDVTAQLAGGPIKARYSDGYFIVIFAGSNKFQISAILDGNTWPGIQVNAVSVFPENIVSIEVSHRELWVFGQQHAQPYQNTGTDEIFDVIPGALIETGAAATFGVDLVDNTIFWISQDIRGGRQAWRASGYTPQRISTHAVEAALSSYSADQVSNLVSYSYQDGGHLFWVLYIPNTDCTWVYDVAESLWHKRAEWDGEGSSTPSRYEYTNATGQVWFLVSRPLDQSSWIADWSNFAIPAGNSLPSDAVIQGIYPVMVANADGVIVALQAMSYGGGSVFPSGFGMPFATAPISPGQDFATTTFWAPSIGTSLSILPSQSMEARLDSSPSINNMTDHLAVTACGYAIYYTSATPSIDPQMPPPFPIPAGQGLLFAVPSTTTNNQPAGTGMVKITSTQATSGGGTSVVTYGYSIIFGPVPAVGMDVNISGTIALGGAFNVHGGLITSVTPDTFTITFGGSLSSPITAESGVCTTCFDPTLNTGGAESAAATATFIPGTEHIPTGTYGPHRSWNHSYAFGKHLVGDWKTGNLWEMKLAVDNHDGTYDFVTDNGNPIRRVRRAPTLNDEMEWVYYTQLIVDFATGLGPQPPLLDGNGNPRPPQAMLRWSNDGGSTWSNQHIANCGFAGEYSIRVIWRRLGRGRKRVFELTVSDPVPQAITDSYVKTA